MMKNTIIYFIIISCLVGCKKREYVHDNSFCIYKNYVTGDTIPYDITNLTNTVDTTLMRSNRVLYLNLYNFIHKKNVKILKVQNSLYKFLCKEYLKCQVECDMNNFGINDLERKDMIKVPEEGCFYFCGQLLLHQSVNSLIFLRTNYKNHFDHSDLILFNIKEKRIRSVIKISEYWGEEKEEDVAMKTYLINNISFISVLNPFEMNSTEIEWSLIKKNKKIDFERSNDNKKLFPFYYSNFIIDSNGYALFRPTYINIKNINSLEKQGKIRKKIQM